MSKRITVVVDIGDKDLTPEEKLYFATQVSEAAAFAIKEIRKKRDFIDDDAEKIVKNTMKTFYED